MDSNKCKTCKTELTMMPQGCKRCLNCNPIPASRPTPKQDDTKYVDVPWTKERILEAIREDVWGWIEDKVEDWFSPARSGTADSAQTITQQVEAGDLVPREAEELTYRQKAKLLGITTYGKTKEAVLVEIAEKSTLVDNN